MDTYRERLSGFCQLEKSHSYVLRIDCLRKRAPLGGQEHLSSGLEVAVVVLKEEQAFSSSRDRRSHLGHRLRHSAAMSAPGV